jgi:hypothetical protein
MKSRVLHTGRRNLCDDRVEDLVGFFERVGLDGIEGLLAIPGAAVFRAQAGHDGNEPREGLRRQ